MLGRFSFLKILPAQSIMLFGRSLTHQRLKGKHYAFSTFSFPCSNRLTWNPGSGRELINICWCKVFSRLGNKDWWERKISQEPKWCLINIAFQVAAQHISREDVYRECLHTLLPTATWQNQLQPAATSLHWMNFRRFILFPDGRYWKYRKAAFAALRGFQVLVWGGEVNSPGHMQTSGYRLSSTSLVHFNPSWLKAGLL